MTNPALAGVVLLASDTSTKKGLCLGNWEVYNEIGTCAGCIKNKEDYI